MVYDFKCGYCGHIFEDRTPMGARTSSSPCPDCIEGEMVNVGWRQFTPTVHILVPEHFRHSQRDFLPPKGDPAWEGIQMGGESQRHERPSAGDQLAKELERA